MTALVQFLSCNLRVPSHLRHRCMGWTELGRAEAAPVRTAEAAPGTTDREEVKKHLWFLFSPSSKSVN